MGILDASNKKDLALNFINFINTPEIAAINSEEIYFATPNNGAKALQSNEFTSNKTIYPDDEVIKNSFHYESLDTENLKLRNRIIQSLMVKYEAQ